MNHFSNICRVISPSQLSLLTFVISSLPACFMWLKKRAVPGRPPVVKFGKLKIFILHVVKFAVNNYA